MIQGPWFVTRAALDDFARLTGESRPALDQQIAAAHFVKRSESGAEIWRGPKPLRLRFIVRTEPGPGGDAPQLVRIEGASAQRAAQRIRQVRIWTGVEYQSLSITGECVDPGLLRRVAYRLASGLWVTGERGRARPDHVQNLSAPLRNAPGWVRELLDLRSRRGGQ